MAVFNEPTKWQTSLVSSGDANTIPQSTPAGTGKASFKNGFPQLTQIPLNAGGVAPDRKDFNGLFKILGDWIFFAQNGGLPTYSSDFDYVAGRVVLYNGNLYKCIQANGVSSTVVAPDSGTEYWQRLDNFVRSVNSVNADDNGNVSITSVNHATTADRAYPRMVGGEDINFHWEGRDGQPALLWGGRDTNMYLYNPSNFSVNHALKADNADHATNADNATNLGGYPATDYIRSVTGEIKWFAFNTAPDGYIICNGANVSRTTYAKLFAVIGTKFGSGDGSTTFTLPNLIDKFAQGSTTVGTVKSAGLPNILGNVNDRFTSGDHELVGSGAFYIDDQLIVVRPATGISVYAGRLYFDASRSNSIYGNSTTVQPPALTLLPCIKY